MSERVALACWSRADPDPGVATPHCIGADRSGALARCSALPCSLPLLTLSRSLLSHCGIAPPLPPSLLRCPLASASAVASRLHRRSRRSSSAVPRASSSSHLPPFSLPLPLSPQHIMVLLEQATFLSELTRLFTKSNQAQAGSVQITFKPRQRTQTTQRRARSRPGKARAIA